MKKHRLTNQERRAIYARDNYACVLCDDNRRLQLHHLVKRSQGGSDNPQNIVTLCNVCHALAHGISLAGVEYFIPQEDIEQALCEYLADLYAPDWNPWKKHPLDG